MDYSDQWQQILDRALARGWDDPDWHEGDSLWAAVFNDGCSFIKALVGTGRCCHICGTGSPETHLPICSAIGLSYANRTYWVATHLVVMPDEKRIPWLYDCLFKEKVI